MREIRLVATQGSQGSAVIETRYDLNVNGIPAQPSVENLYVLSYLHCGGLTAFGRKARVGRISWCLYIDSSTFDAKIHC